MKRILTATLCAFALTLVTPASAQDEVSATSDEVQKELDAIGSLFGDMFGTADSLTPEEEKRVPMAQNVVLKLFPEGTYAKMMDESMKPMMDGMLTSIVGSPAIILSELTGLPPSALTKVDDVRLSEAAAMLDPNAEARNTEILDMTMNLISDVVVKIEPSYRAGLARAYAVRFTEDELADLNTYFATSVGSKYAAESFLIYADPQVMSSMNEMMPAVMEAMPGMMTGASEVAAKYPKGRTFSKLSPEEQGRLAELLGTTLEELAASEPVPLETRAPAGSEAEEAALEQEWIQEEAAS